MRRGLTLAIIVAGLAAAASPARAEMPDYDVDAYCKRIGTTVGGSAEIEHACLEQEQAAYDLLKPKWDTLPARTKAYCDNVGRTVGQSFEILKACVAQETRATTANQQFKFQR